MASYSTGILTDELQAPAKERDNIPRANLAAMRRYARRTEGPGKIPAYIITHVMGVSTRWNYNAGSALYESELTQLTLPIDGRTV